jgi:hypothetical protein
MQPSLIALLASSLTDKLRRLRQKDELPCSYSLHLHLDCLPQENGRWICRASLNDWRLSAIEYGQTIEESLLKLSMRSLQYVKLNRPRIALTVRLLSVFCLNSSKNAQQFRIVKKNLSG